MTISVQINTIMHNSVSLDMAYKDFKVNLEKHYEISRKFKPDIHLIGSNTALNGLELSEEAIPDETEEDKKKPIKDAALPYWVIVDSTGKLNGKLHAFRSFHSCRDAIVLVSDKTPKEYIEYLVSRDYDYICTGKEKVDFKRAYEIMFEKYLIERVLVDSGPTLNKVLFDCKITTNISLVIHPEMVGVIESSIFSGFPHGSFNLSLAINENIGDGILHLVYAVSYI